MKQGYVFSELNPVHLDTHWEELGDGGVSPGVDVYQVQDFRRTIFSYGSPLNYSNYPFEDAHAKVIIFSSEEEYNNYRANIRYYEY